MSDFPNLVQAKGHCTFLSNLNCMGEGPMGKILYLPRFGMILTLELLGRIGNVWTGFCQGRENTCIYYGQGFLQRFAMTLTIDLETWFKVIAYYLLKGFL